MRGSRAKRERKADPSRPNPGRLGGGRGKVAVREKADSPESKFRSMMGGRGRRRANR